MTYPSELELGGDVHVRFYSPCTKDFLSYWWGTSDQIARKCLTIKRDILRNENVLLLNVCIVTKFQTFNLQSFNYSQTESPFWWWYRHFTVILCSFGTLTCIKHEDIWHSTSSFHTTLYIAKSPSRERGEERLLASPFCLQHPRAVHALCSWAIYVWG